jgi:hypothetical protein
MFNQKALQLFVVAMFAATSMACGQIEIPMTLALLGEDNSIEMTLLPDTPQATTFDIDLEGGVETRMVVELSLTDLIFKHGIFSQIVIDDLLFAGTPFTILGIPTEEVCVVVDENAAGGGGVAFIDIFNSLVSFDMQLATAVLIGNDFLGGAIPDGFPFAIDVQSTAELTILDMLGLIFGSADGGLQITQTIEDTIIADIDLGGPAPLQLPIQINASLTLGTANEFPTGTLLNDCYAFLAERAGP